MAIICEKWTPRRSNTLLGFADVLLEQTHLRICDVAIHEKGGRRWASLPGRPMIDREGMALRGDDGKLRYAKILEFDSREAGDEFSKNVVAAVLAHSPGAFEGADAFGLPHHA
jgi:hypothetical protein